MKTIELFSKTVAEYIMKGYVFYNEESLQADYLNQAKLTNGTENVAIVRRKNDESDMPSITVEVCDMEGRWIKEPREVIAEVFIVRGKEMPLDFDPTAYQEKVEARRISRRSGNHTFAETLAKGIDTI